MDALLHGTLPPDAEFCTVIMAGGSGTRFWPMSRRAVPKQYLALSPSGRSLLQETVERVRSLPGKGALLVVTNASQLELVKEHAPEAVVLIEPEAKNTAPALALAAAAVLEKVGDIPLLCLPADHLIGNIPAITELYSQALRFVTEGDVLATIGIRPTAPETGYGYIRCGAELPFAGAFEVHAFFEKPSFEKALGYLADGRYLWNSGMFLWRPSVLLNEVQKSLPDLAQAIEQIKFNPNNYEEIAKIFGQIRSISIDFGVMESAANVAVFQGSSFTWSDVGSWHSWAENTTQEVTGDGYMTGCKDSAVWASSRFVAAVGLEGVVVVETADAVLVCKRERSQEVKTVVDHLVATGRKELL